MKKISLRIICMMLSAVLCFSLAGCAPADERAFERACALMDEGEYEAAIEAFAAIGMYQEISEKIDEAKELLDEENSEFLYGDWVNVHTGTVFTFSKGGKGTISSDGQDTPFTYTCDGKNVEITDPVPLQLKADKEDGVLHLKDQEGLYDLVSQKDFEKMGPVTVEITMDNWEDYFEGRQTRELGLDIFDNDDPSEIGYGIFLKEEYVSRIDNPSVAINVIFEIEYGFVPYLITIDPDSGEPILTETRLPRDTKAPGKQSAILPILDHSSQNRGNPEFDKNNSIYGFISEREIIQHDDDIYILLVGNVKVTAVYGSMVLLP